MRRTFTKRTALSDDELSDGSFDEIGDKGLGEKDQSDEL